MRQVGWCVCGSWHARALAVIVVFGVPLTVAAQESTPSASDTALARSLGSEGVQLADAGNCEAAIEKLDRAEKLYHAPTILGRLGECQVAVGKVVAGTESLQRVVREALSPRAPKAFVDAQARAQKVLDTALPKLAKLKIHIDMPPGVTPTVTLDGEVISLAALDLDRPADPGAHRIEASAPGFRMARTETILAEGAMGSATLKLEPDPSATPAAVGAAPGPAPGAGVGPSTPFASGPGPNGGSNAPVGAEDTGSSKTGAYLLLGAGGLGVALGSVFGLMALGKKSSLDDACKPDKGRCPSTAQGDIDAMRSSATVSTIGFAVGGVSLGAGLVWLLVSKPATAENFQSAPVRATLQPLVGPGSIGLSGSF